MYYIGLFSFFSFAKNRKPKRTKTLSVSVIIACKNEANNLKQFLPSILNQNYPEFEIVLVNDASSDTTLEVMLMFKESNNNVQVLSLPITESYSGNKKNAVSKGISQAKFENLLFTDADCVPNSENWIREMANSFDVKKQIVLGYGAYKKQKGFLNKLIRYETLLTAWQYFSYTRLGMPYMGVGRNIAYNKTLFNKAKGFESHVHIRSGDDDLFVNQIATKNNVALCYSTNSFTISEPKSTLKSWIKQKRRHLTTATSYKPLHQILLGLFYISQFWFLVLIPILLVSRFKLYQVLILIGLRYFFYYLSLIPTAIKLQEKDLIIGAAFIEISLVLIQMRIFVSNIFRKPQEW